MISAVTGCFSILLALWRSLAYIGALPSLVSWYARGPGQVILIASIGCDSLGCLSNSTHIMCLVSPNTVRSWWVPYELGFGKKSGKPLATLKLKDTVNLPAYLEISEIINGTKSLNQYLASIKRGLTKTAAVQLTESLITHTASPHPLDRYLDWQQ